MGFLMLLIFGGRGLTCHLRQQMAKKKVVGAGGGDGNNSLSARVLGGVGVGSIGVEIFI